MIHCVKMLTGSQPVRSFITSPATHSVGGQTTNGRWCLLSSVGVCNTHGVPAGGFTSAVRAMMP